MQGPKWRLAALLHDAPEYVIGDMISPVKAAVGPGYGALDDRLSAAVHIRFGLPAVIPAKVKKEIKRADRVSAWLEATQIAGFSQHEADRFFGAPDSRVITGLEIRLRPRFEVREAYLDRHAGFSPGSEPDRRQPQATPAVTTCPSEVATNQETRRSRKKSVGPPSQATARIGPVGQVVRRSTLRGLLPSSRVIAAMAPASDRPKSMRRTDPSIWMPSASGT
jgi:hypothetical protein